MSNTFQDDESLGQQSATKIKEFKFDYFEESSEGGSIKGREFSGELKSLEVEVFGELGNVFSLYVFKNGELKSSKRTEKFYNHPFYMDSSTVIKIETKECLLNIDQCCDTLLFKKRLKFYLKERKK